MKMIFDWIVSHSSLLLYVCMFLSGLYFLFLWFVECFLSVLGNNESTNQFGQKGATFSLWGICGVILTKLDWDFGLSIISSLLITVFAIVIYESFFKNKNPPFQDMGVH